MEGNLVDVSELTFVLGGDDLLEPGDVGSDDARAFWNVRFDRWPDLPRAAAELVSVRDITRS